MEEVKAEVRPQDFSSQTIKTFRPENFLALVTALKALQPKVTVNNREFVLRLQCYEKPHPTLRGASKLFNCTLPKTQFGGFQLTISKWNHGAYTVYLMAENLCIGNKMGVSAWENLTGLKLRDFTENEISAGADTMMS